MKKLATLAAVLTLVGCAGTSEKMMMSEATDYPSLIKQAQASIKKAASVGGEWRDSKKILKSAEKAAKAGDKDKAMMLAKKAVEQGKLGYEQALAQKNAGPWLF